MKCNVLIVVFFLKSMVGFGQNKSRVDFSKSCSYNGKITNVEVYEFVSSNEAQSIMTEIVDIVGLKPNFKIMAANVSNAVAVVFEGVRYIYYSEKFIESINQRTGTNWAAVGVLAHELGHHLNGHTLEEIGSRPDKELEADEFSGFVLGRMGATLDQATICIKQFGNDLGSKTHAPKSARIEAITIGWKKAQGQSKTQTNKYEVGNVCFLNPNFYARKVIMIKRGSQDQHELLIGPGQTRKSPANSCIYDIPVGVYDCEIFTTFTKLKIESFSLRVEKKSELVKELNMDHKN